MVGSIFGLLQGGFRNNEFPSLAIDFSQGPGKGPLYVAWNDGRNGVTPDGFPPGFIGITYNFGDAFVTRSDDGGTTWSAAVKVNDDIGAANHIDHYLPGVAVSGNGTLGVCWYDRRRDSENFLIDRECASSRDRGQTWEVSETPLAAGSESAGIFSIAFRDKDHGMIVGGDYRKPNDTGATVATTADSGKTWTLVDKALPFRSAVAWAKDRWVAVGTSGSHVSLDDGATWKLLDQENYNSVAFTPGGGGWAVGPKGQIAKFEK